jgi:hypothetical protein
MPSPYRREELIADMATLVYLLSDDNGDKFKNGLSKKGAEYF